MDPEGEGLLTGLTVKVSGGGNPSPCEPVGIGGAYFGQDDKNKRGGWRLCLTAASGKRTAVGLKRDGGEIFTARRAQSAGAQAALGQKPAEVRVYRRTLRYLADRIGTRLRASGRPGRTLTVRVRLPDLRSVTRSRTLPAPISATGSLAEIAEELVQDILASRPRERTISLLGISVSGLDATGLDTSSGAGPRAQLELPLGLCDEARRVGSRTGTARWLADRAVDAVRDRFGWEAVRYGAVAPRSRSGPDRPVPDAFRQLAEKTL